MVICPWCGTNYPTFRSNCDKCGGPLQLADVETASPDSNAIFQSPPLPPRSISDRYIWHIFFGDGYWIPILVLGILGVVFFPMGAGLILGVVTAFVGVPFLFLGLGFLIATIWLAIRRYKYAQMIVDVLRVGDAARGQITDVGQDYSTAVNGRNPWVVRYQFLANGQKVDGKVTTFNPVGEQYKAGESISVLYLPTDPKLNTIYPHP
jgi:hypothetical protein